MRLCVALLLVSLTGCVHNMHPKLSTSSVDLSTVAPYCESWEIPKIDKGKIICKPSWEDEGYLHDPACKWVYGGDEICNNSI